MTITGSGMRTKRATFWVGAVVAVGIAAVALVSIWGIALPVTTPAVCAAIYPPSAGCAGDARLLPATVWTILIVGAVAAACLLSRRGGWGALAGAFITGTIGLAGYFAALHMRVLLVG